MSFEPGRRSPLVDFALLRKGTVRGVTRLRFGIPYRLMREMDHFGAGGVSIGSRLDARRKRRG